MLKINKLANNNFLSSLDMSTNEILQTLEIAREFKNKNLQIELKDKVLGLIFLIIFTIIILIIYRLGFGISSARKKYVVGDEFRKKRLKLFRHRQAVFVQRRKDAITFGYSQKSSLIKVINRRIRMADIGLKYYSENLNEIRKMFFKYPYLTLRCFLIEMVKKRRNKKKWKNR